MRLCAPLCASWQRHNVMGGGGGGVGGEIEGCIDQKVGPTEIASILPSFFLYPISTPLKPSSSFFLPPPLFLPCCPLYYGVEGRKDKGGTLAR